MNNYSKLLSKAVHKILLANGKKQAMQAEPGSLDQIPAAKLFTPNARATWILTEVMPDDTDLAFGLCDLGLGSPELGYVRISELESLHQGSRSYCQLNAISGSMASIQYLSMQKPVARLRRSLSAM